MNTARKWLFLMWVLLLTLALPTRALAAGPHLGSLSDQFVIGDNFTLKSGETLDEDLFIFGGNASLEKDSLLNGDVVVMGGNLDGEGEIDGNLLILGGHVSLGETAIVTGDITTLGGYVDKDPAARVDGEITSEIWSGVHLITPAQVIVPSTKVIFPSTWDALWWLWLPFVTFVMATLAIIVVMFWPKQIERAAHTAISQPLIAGGMGLLTIVAGVFVLGILAITIILSPVALVGLLLLFALGIFGWIALGLELGQRFAQALKQDWHPALAAGMGTFAITFVAMGINKLVIYIGWVVPFLVTIVALGATLLTIFGTREYRGTILLPSSPVVPPPSEGAAPQA